MTMLNGENRSEELLEMDFENLLHIIFHSYHRLALFVRLMQIAAFKNTESVADKHISCKRNHKRLCCVTLKKFERLKHFAVQKTSTARTDILARCTVRSYCSVH